MQIDAHADTHGPLHQSAIWHGSPFRLAADEGLVDCSRVWQIGLRGGGLVDTTLGTHKVSRDTAATNATGQYPRFKREVLLAQKCRWGGRGDSLNAF